MNTETLPVRVPLFAVVLAVAFGALRVLAPPAAASTFEELFTVMLFGVAAWLGLDAFQSFRDGTWGGSNGVAARGGTAILALAVGGCLLVGNFRVMQVDLTVADKSATGGLHHPLSYWHIRAVADGRNFAAMRGAYKAVTVGERVHCTGSNPPFLPSVLTHCAPLAASTATVASVAP